MIDLPNIALNLGVLIGLGLLLCGFALLVKSGLFHLRARQDRRLAEPLHSALEKMGSNIKARNAKVAITKIEDTF